MFHKQIIWTSWVPRFKIGRSSSAAIESSKDLIWYTELFLKTLQFLLYYIIIWPWKESRSHSFSKITFQRIWILVMYENRNTKWAWRLGGLLGFWLCPLRNAHGEHPVSRQYSKGKLRIFIENLYPWFDDSFFDLKNFISKKDA